ncbi:MAG TPA: Ig-like domain repeat protein [Candidatus Sulfotelmatobacter sp.]|nr:Ig-like domain repeat protein [Candidatus Sulfotelmatobacter sp.]
MKSAPSSCPVVAIPSLLKLILVSAILSGLLHAQKAPASRITRPIDDRFRVALKGNVHPLAQARYDQGPVPDSFAADRMLLLLQRPPEREFALRQFLLSAHRPGNRGYHKWLTPEQFGESYGPDDSEISAVATWLQSHGFTVSRITHGKTAIEFSGTAAQVRQAFLTEIHSYSIGGEQHYANNVDPQIPEALVPVIAGITPMNDFRPQSYLKNLGEARYDPTSHKLTPQWTFPGGGDILDLGPGDFAVQYDLAPLYTAGVTGKGVTIGIIGASNVDPSVVATYRTFFGLSANPINVIIDGSDPGQNSAVVESYLDVEEAGAVAPDATINLYTAADTALQSGLLLAAQRAVDDDVATVLSTSYGVCEQNLGSAGNQFWYSLWEQAAAQGQTSFVSSGDGGSAGCDNFNLGQTAQYGLAVSGFSSTPWNVSVGGTDFLYSSYAGSMAMQQAELAKYWITSSSWIPSTSLLQPVPEQPWNRSFGLNFSNGGVYNPSLPSIVGGSGGASSCSSGTDASDGTFSACTSGYPKPSWQSGAGVPSDRARDIPDVSLFAAAGENDTVYPICTFQGECQIIDGSLTVGAVGGTSASSPAMAGIMALVNQKYGAQGQANYVLYPLAAQHPSVFHDVTQGSNVVPCQVNTPNCAISMAKDNTNGFYTLTGYDAAKGYDLATGLGTIDANLLVKYWNSLHFTPSTTTLSFSATTFTHGSPVKANVAVSGSGGQPTGDVALVASGASAEGSGLGELTLTSGSASSTFNNLPGGQYQVSARYSGDSLFATSNSQPQTLNVTPENSTLTLFGNTYMLGALGYTPLSNGSSYPYGTYISVDAQARGVNAPAGSGDGVATGTVTFNDSSSTSGPINVDHTGVSQWVPASGFSVGAHSLSANYSGDGSFNASSTDAPLNFAVTKATPTIDLFGSNAPIGSGQSVLLQAFIGVSPFVAAASGQVTFYDGTKNLGSAALGPTGFVDPGVSAASLTTNQITALGANSITAVYAGDSNYNSVTSSPVTETVMQSVVLNETVTPQTINPSQSFTASATLAGVAGQPAPTGGIGFYAYGAGGSWSAPGSFANGVWSFTFTGGQWLPGTIYVQAEFAGDAVYAPLTVTVPITMTAPFTIAATPVSIASPGATSGNASTVTITPGGGFTGAVYLSCSLMSYPNSAQKLPTCSIPNSVTVTGTAAVTAQMMINSTAPTKSSAMADPWRVLFMANAGATMVAFIFVGVPSRRKDPRRMLMLLTILCLMALLVSCGGGGGGSTGGGGGGGNTIPGTTAGTYTFMVKAYPTASQDASQPVFTTVTATIQ